MPETEPEPESLWHIEPYDPDIDDPPTPDDHDCIGEHDGEAPVGDVIGVVDDPEGDDDGA